LGFLPNAPYVHPDPCSTKDGQHFLDLIQAYDAGLLVQWSRDSLNTAESFFPLASAPVSHFVKPQVLCIPKSLRAAAVPKKQPAAAKRSSPPDFTAVQPLMELVSAPCTEKGVFQLFASAAPSGSIKPVLRDSDGKSLLLCFSSSVGPLFNSCTLANCHHEQTKRTWNKKFQAQGGSGPPPCCHVNLSQQTWASKPEAYWSSLVDWLRLPGVSQVIRPSEFLKAKTPSTPW
jgi:hypothetical protein